MDLDIILQNVYNINDYETSHHHQSLACTPRDMPVLQFQSDLRLALGLEDLSSHSRTMVR